MHVRNVIGDGVTLHRPVIQAGRIGFGDNKPSSGFDPLDNQGAPVALTRGECEALNTDQRADPDAQNLRGLTAGPAGLGGLRSPTRLMAGADGAAKII